MKVIHKSVVNLNSAHEEIPYWAGVVYYKQYRLEVEIGGERVCAVKELDIYCPLPEDIRWQMVADEIGRYITSRIKEQL